MKIAVCDESMEDIRRLQPFLKEHDVTVYPRPQELLADVGRRAKVFDLYIVDIPAHHPLDGMELAHILRARDMDAVICVTSTSGEFYREAYDLYAVQYLLKPVQGEAVRKLLTRLERSKRMPVPPQEEQRVSFHWRGRLGFLAYEKILYMTSHGHTILIYCTDGSVQECRGKLNEMAEKICGETFCRCHQSFLVNIHYVEMLKGKELLIGDQWIPVSRRYYAQVKQSYREVLAGRMCGEMPGAAGR